MNTTWNAKEWYIKYNKKILYREKEKCIFCNLAESSHVHCFTIANFNYNPMSHYYMLLTHLYIRKYHFTHFIHSSLYQFSSIYANALLFQFSSFFFFFFCVGIPVHVENIFKYLCTFTKLNCCLVIFIWNSLHIS